MLCPNMGTLLSGYGLLPETRRLKAMLGLTVKDNHGKSKKSAERLLC